MHIILASFLLSVAAAPFLMRCATYTSTEAAQKAEDSWKPQIGKATKQDFIQKYGNPEWCKLHPPSNEETCRFYLKSGERWLGETKDRKRIEMGEDVVAEFDQQGLLKSFEVKVQR